MEPYTCMLLIQRRWTYLEHCRGTLWSADPQTCQSWRTHRASTNSTQVPCPCQLRPCWLRRFPERAKPSRLFLPSLRSSLTRHSSSPWAHRNPRRQLWIGVLFNPFFCHQLICHPECTLPWPHTKYRWGHQRACNTQGAQQFCLQMSSHSTIQPWI